jgi:hypothetical protein
MKNVVLHIQYSHEPESEERRAGLACSETSCNFLVKRGISYMIWPNVEVLHLYILPPQHSYQQPNEQLCIRLTILEHS